MRSILGLAAALALASPAFAAEPAKPAKPVAAASAGQFGKTASERGPVLAHGYSERARRIADCLATYPGYDPRTDRVVVGPGQVKRCTL